MALHSPSRIACPTACKPEPCTQQPQSQRDPLPWDVPRHVCSRCLSDAGLSARAAASGAADASFPPAQRSWRRRTSAASSSSRGAAATPSPRSARPFSCTLAEPSAPQPRPPPRPRPDAPLPPPPPLTEPRLPSRPAAACPPLPSRGRSLSLRRASGRRARAAAGLDACATRARGPTPRRACSGVRPRCLGGHACARGGPSAIGTRQRLCWRVPLQASPHPGPPTPWRRRRRSLELFTPRRK
jgi:hypothetical protein